jgi:predicted CXXCH cytochrome family protein
MLYRLLPFAVAVALTSAASAANPAWAGSKACEPCHRTIYRNWRATGMARSSGLASESANPESFERASFSDARSNYSYSVSRDYVLTMSRSGRGDAPVTRRLAYFIGSGAVASSYLIEVDGFLYESPVSYYAASARWDFAPGYDKYSYPYLARAVAPGCIECHASGAKPVAGTQNGYERPPFLEGGVACERCHGPGLAHVRSAKAADIVNPEKLGPERRDSVCQQCHLSGEVRIQRAGSALEFRAGEKFSEWATAFSREGSEAQMSVTSHAANLAQSACRRASGDRMWCGSCHDAHYSPPVAEKAAWYRAKCLACHTPASCRERNATRMANGDNCVSCHMPRRPVTDAAHVVYTDHSIPRRPTQLQNKPNSQNAALIALNGNSASARELGLAYAVLATREQNPAYRRRAFDLLREFLQNKPNLAQDDPEVLSYLADLYRSQGNDREAARLYQLLIKVDASQSSAPAALGAYAMERGDYEQAIRLWTAALRISPALLLVRANLAVALLHTGRRAEAGDVLEKALEFNPEFPAARKLLRDIQ